MQSRSCRIVERCGVAVCVSPTEVGKVLKAQRRLSAALSSDVLRQHGQSFSHRRSPKTSLEPALEGLLRSNEVQIKTLALFTALDSTEGGFMSMCKEAFGVNTDFLHKREWAKLHTASSQAKVTWEAIERVSATKRAHGEPVAFLTTDWTSLTREFKVQRGKLEDEELLGRLRPRERVQRRTFEQVEDAPWCRGEDVEAARFTTCEQTSATSDRRESCT